MSNYTIKDYGTDDTGWYVSNDNNSYFWKDLTFHSCTGFFQPRGKGEKAPGYYHSAEEAKQYLDAYLYIKNLKRSVKIREAVFEGCGGWYVLIDGKFLWDNGKLYVTTGFEDGHSYGQSPGYYCSPADAAFYVDRYVESETEKQLNKIKGIEMDANLKAKLEQNKQDIEKLQEEQKRLEKELEESGKPKPLVVHTLKAEISGNNCWPIRIISLDNLPCPVFTVEEVEEIITGLQKLVDFVENNR